MHANIMAQIFKPKIKTMLILWRTPQIASLEMKYFHHVGLSGNYTVNTRVKPPSSLGTDTSWNTISKILKPSFVIF